MANWFAKTEPLVESQVQDASPVEVQQEFPNTTTEPETLDEPENSLVVSLSPEESDSSISLLNQAHRAITEASSLDELKGIRDKAEAVRKYAQAAGMGLELQNYAAEVKLRAERRAGSLIAKLNLHGGDRREETAEERLTLSDIGVSKDQSSRWQLTATVPEKAFEKFVEQTREENGEVTTAGLVRLANELRAKRKQRRQAEPASTINCRVISTVDDLRTSGSKFACVYVDPPWPGGADNDHFVSVLGEIPLELVVEQHAHIHCWASDDSLFAAKQAIENWGFVFKACLLCLKTEGNPGDYWVDSHEYLLLGVRGELPLMELTINSWMRSNRDQSGAPEPRVRKLIERVSPGPYLELFGRSEASGWTIYSTTLVPSVEANTNESKGADNAEATSA